MTGRGLLQKIFGYRSHNRPGTGPRLEGRNCQPSRVLLILGVASHQVGEARESLSPPLKDQLQAQLDGAGASRTHGGIGSRDVRRGTLAAESSRRSGVVLPVAVLSAIGIGKIRMIQDVEELSTELGAEPFPEVPVLGYREIQIPEARIGEGVPTHRSKLPERRRNHR